MFIFKIFNITYLIIIVNKKLSIFIEAWEDWRQFLQEYRLAADLLGMDWREIPHIINEKT